MLLGSPGGRTGLGSMPRAWAPRTRPYCPNSSPRSGSGRAASSPMVRTPTRSSRRAVAGPQPGSRGRGRLAVRLEVAGHEDRLRAQPPGTAERHRGPNPERAGFVGRRRHDAALAGDARAAHDHGLAAEVRAAKLFHGGVERIEIDVHHDPAHDASLSTSGEAVTAR